MKKGKQQESSTNPDVRRSAIAADVEAFLASGNKIEQISSGVSANVYPSTANKAAAAQAAKTPPTPVAASPAPEQAAPAEANAAEEKAK